MLAYKLLFDDASMDSNDTDFNELMVPDSRRSRQSQNGTKRRRARVSLSSREEQSRPAVGTLARTRTLLLAALRVWELKQGIRS
jgi:hypothetical protein